MTTRDTTAQATITGVVRLLMRLTDTRQQDVADALGLPRPAVSYRLAGRTRWNSDDLDGLADLFGVPLPALLVEPGLLLAGGHVPSAAGVGGGLVQPLDLGRLVRRDTRTRALGRRDREQRGHDQLDLVGEVAGQQAEHDGQAEQDDGEAVDVEPDRLSLQRGA